MNSGISMNATLFKGRCLDTSGSGGGNGVGTRSDSGGTRGLVEYCWIFIHSFYTDILPHWRHNSETHITNDIFK
jgi:hypothetical protein